MKAFSMLSITSNAGTVEQMLYIIAKIAPKSSAQIVAFITTKKLTAVTIQLFRYMKTEMKKIMLMMSTWWLPTIYGMVLPDQLLLTYRYIYTQECFTLIFLTKKNIAVIYLQWCFCGAGFCSRLPGYSTRISCDGDKVTSTTLSWKKSNCDGFSIWCCKLLWGITLMYWIFFLNMLI